MEVKIERAKEILLERQRLSQRLRSLFTSIIPSSGGLYTQKFPQEEQLSLIIHFDQGADPDPLFSGPSLARLYLNEAKDLCLAIWPEERNKEKTSVRQEVLLRKVQKLDFAFLARKDQAAVWEPKRSEKESATVPSLVRVHLWQEGPLDGPPTLEFAFLLPSEEPSILYPAHEKKS